MNTSLNINFQKTALALIDLQKGIVPVDQSGKGVPNGFVKVAFHDGTDALKPETDAPQQASGEQPPDWAEFVPEIGEKENDYTVTKRRWGAFLEQICICSLEDGGLISMFFAGSRQISVWKARRERLFSLGISRLLLPMRWLHSVRNSMNPHFGSSFRGSAKLVQRKSF